MSFIPTAKDATHFELLRDFDKFCNKIRFLSLRRHHITTGKRFPLKRIKKYKPRRSYFSSAKLEGILETIRVELSQIPTTNSLPHNLSLSDRKALRELKCNSDLIINKADKGSTIVVQDRSDYIRNALEHLNDPHTYRVLDGNPTSNICTGINHILLDFLKKDYLIKIW